MSGLDALREEMEKRGLNKAQCESKVAAVVLDILAKTPDKRFEAQWNHEQRKQELKNERYHFEREKEEFYQDRQEWVTEHNKKCKSEYETIEEQKKEIEEARSKLTEAETPEARDKIRLAEYYKKSIDTYDLSRDSYTQYIRSLGMILSDWKAIKAKEDQ